MVFIDGTAGDAVPYSAELAHKGASPLNFMHHVSLLHQKCPGAPVRVLLNELADATFSRLKENVIARYGQPEWLTFSQIDARLLNFSELGFDFTEPTPQEQRAGQKPHGLFLYNDPNAITGWVLTPDVLAQCPKFTCTFSTLGCNVAGLKRLDSAVRTRDWVDKIDSVQSVMAPWHDAGLFLVGDASSWAYLVTCPMRWRNDVQDSWLKELKSWGGLSRRAKFAWLREDPQRFEECKMRLVMTADEFRAYEVKQQELFGDDSAA